jgi:hypothetical protein
MDIHVRNTILKKLNDLISMSDDRLIIISMSYPPRHHRNRCLYDLFYFHKLRHNKKITYKILNYFTDRAAAQQNAFMG